MQMSRWTWREWLAWPLADPIMIPIILIVIGLATAALVARRRFVALSVMIAVTTLLLAGILVYQMYTGNFPFTLGFSTF